MRTRSLVVGAFVSTALVTVAPWASAQVRLEFVSRRGPRGTTLVRTDQIGSLDCTGGDRWTFRADLPTAASGAPTLWVSDDLECAPANREPAAGARCFQLCGSGPRDVCASPLLAGLTRYTVEIPASRIADGANASCGAAVTVRRVFLMVEGVVAARSLPITIDTVAPLPVGSATATADEGRATVNWDNTFDGGTDAGAITDVGDAGDVGDVGDTGVDIPVVTDTGVDAGPPLASREAPRRVFVLCDPPRGMEPANVTPTLDASTCGTGALTTLDPNDDTALARYRCNDDDAGTGSPASIGGLRNGASYRFGVVIEDQAGNRSTVVTTSTCTTPRSLTDFWEHYRYQRGGAEPGFCAARPGMAGRPAWWTLGLGAATLAFVARRRR